MQTEEALKTEQIWYANSAQSPNHVVQMKLTRQTMIDMDVFRIHSADHHGRSIKTDTECNNCLLCST